METTALKMFTDTVKYKDNHIFVKPLCDFFEIDYDNQVSRIKKDPEMASRTGKNRCEVLFSDTRLHFSLTKNGFLMWILSINPSLVREDLREKFIRYKSLILDYLYGTTEEHENICRLNAKLQSLRTTSSQIRNEIKITQVKLTNALNQVYQYRIDFQDPKAIEE